MKYLAWIVIVLALVLAGYLMWENKKVSKIVSGSETEREQPTRLNKLIFYEYLDNKLKWRFVADSAEMFEQKQETYFENIKGKIINSGDADSNITTINADNAKMVGDKKNIELKGSVLITMGEFSALRTKQLFFDQSKESLYSEVEVVFQNENDIIKGESMNYDLKDELLLLKKPQAEIVLQ